MSEYIILIWPKGSLNCIQDFFDFIEMPFWFQIFLSKHMVCLCWTNFVVFLIVPIVTIAAPITEHHNYSKGLHLKSTLLTGADHYWQVVEGRIIRGPTGQWSQDHWQHKSSLQPIFSILLHNLCKRQNCSGQQNSQLSPPQASNPDKEFMATNITCQADGSYWHCMVYKINN